MIRRIGMLLALVWIGAMTMLHADGQQRSTRASASQPAVRRVSAETRAANASIVSSYCVTCHNDRLKTGGLVLDPSALADVPAHAETWEKVVRKLRAGLMPPPGMPRPPAEALAGLVGALEDELDRAAAASPNPGRPMLHRLNRAEYANAIRDLLHLQVDTATLLPPDDSAYGFDNVADVLGVSPSLQERYLAAASKISALAVGDVNIPPSSETYRVRQDLSQNQHIDGLPLGTIGGIRLTHFFPVDATYDIKTTLYRTNLNIVRGLEYPNEFEIAIDGRPVHRVMIGGQEDLAALFEKPTDTGDAVEARMRAKIPVTAGSHEVTVTFIGNLAVEDTQRLQTFLRSSADNFDWTGRPHIQTVAIAGPFRATSPGNSESRAEIFSCQPGPTMTEARCARQILSRLARRAYRRPVAEADLKPVLQFYDEGREKGSFDAGIARGLERILASPLFMFRVETDPPSPSASARQVPSPSPSARQVPSPAASGRQAPSVRQAPAGLVYRVSDVELASRLSFFLWSSIPDDELLGLAEQGRLRNELVLTKQIDRMLADPKADALITNFAGQWLQLRNVRSVQPNSDLYPDFDDNLRQSFRRETELLFDSIVREDRPVLDLLTADYTFVNERLARHYGIPGVYGSRFRRVPVKEDARRGLLGHGSILALTSHAERTSPVLRGKWVLDNLLGLPVPPPPADVNTNLQQSGDVPRTLRAQMEAHRSSPVCASCHRVMDPIGFALENFDVVGAWRSREPGGAIDASGQLADGTKINGVVELRKAIVARPELFVSTMTEKLLIYAIGRGLDTYDMPTVRRIVAEAKKDNYQFSSIVRGIIHSTPFQMRVKRET